MKTVLVAEDSFSIREYFSVSLEKAGYKVLKGEDGQKALDLLNGQDIDMVITDINMPKMSGIELIKEIRSKESYQYIPIIVCSTESNVTKQKAFDAGATGCMDKKVRKEKLLLAVHKLIRS